jgi:hypothetical protein
MNDDIKRGSGWTAGKVIGMILAVIGLIGFGLGGLCGLVFAVGGMQEGFLFAIPGLVLAALFMWAIRKIRRSVHGKR